MYATRSGPAALHDGRGRCKRRARVFMMREFLEIDPEELAAELAISKSNCGVILHRTRVTLCVCPQTRWFDERGNRKC